MSGPETPETVDALAARAVERAAPVCFRAAATMAEREASYQLRYQAVVDQGWLDPAELPDGREWEPVDDDATHLLGLNGEQVVASCRMIFPVRDRPLPVESLFEIEVEPEGEVVQVDRVCVVRHASDAWSIVMAGLMCASWLEARHRGYSSLAGLHTKEMTRLTRSLGFVNSILGPPRWYWGAERIPVQFTAANLSPAFRRHLERHSPSVRLIVHSEAATADST
jgi:N-acyl-L-homoserine lactone synthetase